MTPRNIIAPIAAIAIILGFLPAWPLDLTQWFDLATLLSFTAFFWRAA